MLPMRVLCLLRIVLTFIKKVFIPHSKLLTWDKQRDCCAQNCSIFVVNVDSNGVLSICRRTFALREAT